MNVVFYEKEDGTIPIVDFFDSLDAKVSRTIRLLEVNGHQLRAPHSKELRKH